MVWYKESARVDPYFDLWNREEWLHPLDNLERTFSPLIITVEPTNGCQNQCLYCSRQLMDREIGFMELEVMEKVAREADENNAAIRHGGFGEPLLHPEIDGVIAICKQHSALTTIFTNGTCLTEDMMGSFVDSGLDEIRFSSSGITESEHNRIRRNSEYERDFDDRIRMAFRVRGEKNSRRPFLTVYTNVLDYDDEEFKMNVEKYRDKYLQYADKVDIDLTMFSRVKELEHVKPLYETQTIEETHKPCLTLFLKIIVHWNGDVFACDIPYDFEDSYFLGNVMDDGFSIKAAYNSPKIGRLRENMTFNRNHNRYALCKDCYSNTKKWESKDWLLDA